MIDAVLLDPCAKIHMNSFSHKPRAQRKMGDISVNNRTGGLGSSWIACDDVASDLIKFCSVGGTCISLSNPNTTGLVSIFKTEATRLLKMRRIPNSAT